MRITAFTEGESGEPTTIPHGEIVMLGEDRGDYAEIHETTLAELVTDVTNCGLEDIDVVSTPVATIALHALHGILSALDPAKAPTVPRWGAAKEARAWALAALRELAFYDIDGIEVVQPCTDCGRDDCAHEQHDEAIAGDPGREAVDKVRAGSRLTRERGDELRDVRGQDLRSFYVEWPGA